jgi:hypothetical protein
METGVDIEAEAADTNDDDVTTDNSGRRSCSGLSCRRSSLM